MMIGQRDLIRAIDKMAADGSFPRFTILVGKKGSGKKEMAKYAARKLRAMHSVPGLRIEDVRQAVEAANTAMQRIMFVFPDAHGLSTAAKNALLKVTEETPKGAYFLLTFEDEDQVIDTLRSRARVLKMGALSQDEKLEYFMQKCGDAPPVQHIAKCVVDVCDVFGEIDTLMRCDIQEFLDYVDLVIENIFDADEANVFKIGKKIKLKEDSDGYDLMMFFRILTNKIIKRASAALDVATYRNGNVKKELDMVDITLKYMKELNLKSVNKQMLIDNWIIEIRGLNNDKV